MARIICVTSGRVIVCDSKAMDCVSTVVISIGLMGEAALVVDRCVITLRVTDCGVMRAGIVLCVKVAGTMSVL